jgi:hypothetical protein
LLDSIEPVVRSYYMTTTLTDILTFYLHSSELSSDERL